MLWVVAAVAMVVVLILIARAGERVRTQAREQLGKVVAETRRAVGEQASPVLGDLDMLMLTLLPNFGDLKDLTDGVNAWRHEGAPVVKTVEVASLLRKLKEASLVRSPEPGRYVLTPKGWEVLGDHVTKGNVGTFRGSKEEGRA